MERSAEKVAGIEPDVEPCWYAETADGHAFEYGDGSPHWQSEQQASEQLTSMLKYWDDAPDERPSLTLRRETEPCWHLTCAECGYRFDEDEWVSHFPDRREAESTADDCDWHVIDARMLCPECYLTSHRRSDRGAADTRWLNLGALLVGLGRGSYLWPPLAWVLAGLLAYLLLAVPLAICVGRVVRGGAR